MARKIIKTDQAPAAIGSYSQAVMIDNIVYLSGQIPMDTKTMSIIEGTFEDQIKRVFMNLQAVANAAGCSLDDAVKLNVYLTDMDNFPVVNEVMSIFFKEPFPARAAIGVSNLPKGALVEVDAVLHKEN
jgi:reactive intermediate/imine deaminase